MDKKTILSMVIFNSVNILLAILYTIQSEITPLEFVAFTGLFIINWITYMRIV